MPRRARRRRADARPDWTRGAARRSGGGALRRQQAAREHRHRPSRLAPGLAARRAQHRARPAPARTPLGVHRGARRRGHNRRLLHPQRAGGRALRRPGGGARGRRAPVRRLPARAREPRRGDGPRLRGGLRRLPAAARSLAAMRWLLLKDLQILRRSPLLVALLVLYPIVIAVLIGFAISRGPEKPRVAFVDLVPPSASVLELNGQKIDVSKYGRQIFSRIDPVYVKTEKDALDKVKSGDVLAALVIPADLTQKLEAGTGPATVRVYYNAEDPVKAQFVQDTIKAEVQDANTALTKQFTKIALNYLDLISTGGQISIFGQSFSVLGLEKSEAIVNAAQAGLPRNDPLRGQLGQVANFARLARENLDLSNGVLAAVGQPIKAQQTIVNGDRTPLDAFAVAIAVTVSLMFVTLLLASGILALER